jgi:pyruvate/2-oxoglutarate dehydrogenase complex dihydrolipoamide acyltransferase (E2) component
MLLSPIDGVVTGVFVDAGDSVRAGEVLVRVENNLKVLLDTTLVYRGSVAVGDTVAVQTDLFSKAANSVTISGTVVAARGEADDDRWKLVVSCDNRDNNGDEILPLNYSFDHGNTSSEIS